MDLILHFFVLAEADVSHANDDTSKFSFLDRDVFLGRDISRNFQT